jgi:HEAT repeat protein
MFDWLRFWNRRRNPPKGEEPRPAPPPPPVPDAPPVAPEHEPLLRALDDPSPEARYRAAEELARVGAPVVPALAGRLGHSAAHVRQAAALALGEIGPDAAPALAALVRAAIDRDEGVRRVASEVLARVDPAWPVAAQTRLALPALVEGMRSDLPRVSRAAAALLVRVGRPAVPALVELLADWEAEATRLAAFHILAQLGPSAAEAAPALAAVVASGEPPFRQAAAEALARLGAAAAPAVPDLIRALSDWSPPARQWAARALAAVGPAAGHAVPTLLGLLADYDDGVREAAAEALVSVGEPAVPLLALVLEERDLRRAGDRPAFREAVDRLWRQLDAEGGHGIPDRAWRTPTWAAREGLREQTEFVHEAAARVLGRLGPAAAPAAPALAQALCDQSERVRSAAARALGEIGGEAAPVLVSALASEDHVLREAAATTLGRLGPAARCAVPALTAALRDPRVGVRQAAAQALAQVAPATPPGG